MKKREWQHTVPKAFLNHFTKNGKGYFYFCDVGTKKINIAHVKDSCVSEDFYEIPEKLLNQRYKGTDADFIERHAFKQYEQRINSLIRKFKEKETKIYRSEFEIIVRGYISQKHRSPFYRKQLGNLEQRAKSADTVIAQFQIRNPVLSNLTSPGFFDSIRHQFLNDKHEPVNSHIIALVESVLGNNHAIEDATRHLLNMKVRVIEAPAEQYFLTSDNPGFSLQALPDRKFAIHNTNFGYFESITFPINSKQALFFWDFGNMNNLDIIKPIEYNTIDIRGVNEINYATTIIADEKVFCEDEEYLKRFIEKFDRNSPPTYPVA